MSYTPRIISTPGSSVACEVTNIKTTGLPFSPYYVDLFRQTFTSSFERYTPNSSGSKSDWKNFSHFRSVSDPSDSNSGFNLIADPPGFYPNDYSHIKTNYRGFGYDRYTFDGYILPGIFGDGGQLDADLPLFYEPDASGEFVPPPADLNQLNQRALSSMLPLIKTELSLPN
jgi:hypothetical protein